MPEAGFDAARVWRIARQSASRDRQNRAKALAKAEREGALGGYFGLAIRRSAGRLISKLEALYWPGMP